MGKRRRVYDNRSNAVAMRETFVARAVEHETTFAFGWPEKMQQIGDSLAVAYASDKWKPKGKNGRREVELYKHLSESRNRIFSLPGLVRAREMPDRRIDTVGPLVSFYDCPLPRHFAVLGLFKEVNVQLYTEGSSSDPGFGADEDDGVVTLTVRHGMLGGGQMLWSKNENGASDEPFLFVYTEQDGVMFIIVGENLDIEKDGIVG